MRKKLNEAMIAKWNAKVKPGDAVFMLRSRMLNAGVDDGLVRKCGNFLKVLFKAGLNV